jgi:hypothetical protein
MQLTPSTRRARTSSPVFGRALGSGAARSPWLLRRWSQRPRQLRRLRGGHRVGCGQRLRQRPQCLAGRFGSKLDLDLAKSGGDPAAAQTANVVVIDGRDLVRVAVEQAGRRARGANRRHAPERRPEGPPAREVSQQARHRPGRPGKRDLAPGEPEHGGPGGQLQRPDVAAGLATAKAQRHPAAQQAQVRCVEIRGVQLRDGRRCRPAALTARSRSGRTNCGQALT